MVVPIGKGLPGSCVVLSVCVPELSVAEGGVQVTFPVGNPGSVVPDISLGQPDTTGLSVSDKKNGRGNCFRVSGNTLRKRRDMKTNFNIY